MTNPLAASPDLANLFAAHTNPFELALFWEGSRVSILAIRVNGQRIDADDVRTPNPTPPAARFNLPPPFNGNTYAIQAVIGPANGTAKKLVIGIKNDATDRLFAVDQKDSLSVGDDLWIVTKTVTVS